MMHQMTALTLAALLLLPAAAAEAAPAEYWNNNADFPIIATDDGGYAWYLNRGSARIAANDAESLIFSVDVLRVDAEQDPSAFEFHRWWFRKPQSEDPYTVFMRQGDAGDWSPLDLRAADAESLSAVRLFLAGWQAATGFSYGLSPADSTGE